MAGDLSHQRERGICCEIGGLVGVCSRVQRRTRWIGCSPRALRRASVGGSAAPSGDAKQLRAAGALDLTSSKGLLDPPLTSIARVLSSNCSAGEPMAERVAAATDPLNLMRVMPTKEARS
jgi:hypothetical protein